MGIVNTSVILEGLEADIPVSGDMGKAGRLYFTTDTGKILRDNGVAWIDRTPSGSGGAQVVIVEANDNQTIPNITDTSVTLDTVLGSNADAWSIQSSSLLELNVGFDGDYEPECWVILSCWAVAGDMVELTLNLNGTPFAHVSGVSNGVTSVFLRTHPRLSLGMVDGDSFEIIVKQTSGADRLLRSAGTDLSSGIKITKVG